MWEKQALTVKVVLSVPNGNVKIENVGFSNRKWETPR
jgi:hypothetical protein